MPAAAILILSAVGWGLVVGLLVGGLVWLAGLANARVKAYAPTVGLIAGALTALLIFLSGLERL